MPLSALLPVLEPERSQSLSTASYVALIQRHWQDIEKPRAGLSSPVQPFNALYWLTAAMSL